MTSSAVEELSDIESLLEKHLLLYNEVVVLSVVITPISIVSARVEIYCKQRKGNLDDGLWKRL